METPPASQVYDPEQKKFGVLGINSVDRIEPTLETIDEVFWKVNDDYDGVYDHLQMNYYNFAALLTEGRSPMYSKTSGMRYPTPSARSSERCTEGSPRLLPW